MIPSFIKQVGPILVTSNDEMYLGTSSNGIFHSNDDGESWTEINHGLANSVVLAFTINDDDVLVAGINGGLSVSSDDGNTWQQIDQGLTSQYLYRMAASQNGSIFTGSSCPGDHTQFMLRSLDNGYTWTELTNIRRCVLALTVDLNENIFAGTFSPNGIYRSTDNGETWDNVDSDLRVRSFAVNKNNEIFAGTIGGLYHSTDNGLIWNLLSTPVANPSIYRMAINSQDILFVEMDSLYRSLDDGKSWEVLDFVGSAIRVLFIDFHNNLWAGTFSDGIFYSQDNGESWVSSNTGLEGITVFSFSMNRQGILFAGTDRGIYRSQQRVVSVYDPPIEIPGSFQLQQNYPNPFNLQTKISFQLPFENQTELKIFNLLGETVRVLVDDELGPGHFSINWNGEDESGRLVTSGIYFSKLVFGDFSKVKIMTIVK